MNKFLAVLAVLLAVCIYQSADAKGGFSSGGGGRSSFSSGGSVSRSYSSPSVARSAPRSSTTTTTTTSRSSSSYRGGGYYGGGMMYGGMGMGYGYSNGLLTGLIIGNMMHPQNTTVYNGPGGYANNALLYPDGQVVSSAGQLLGTYQNGQFNAIQNGPIVAQPAPPQQAQPQPVVIQQDRTAENVFAIVLIFVIFIVVFLIVRI